MEFDLVRRLGVKVVELDGLVEDVCYVDDVQTIDRDGTRTLGVALIRSGLPCQARRDVADWLLSEVATKAATAS